MPSWNITGQYMETCNCEQLCPCIYTNMTAQPTEGHCYAAVAMRIDQGAKDGVKLDGLSFVVMLDAPGPMLNGNMTVGLIVDESASDAQVEAIKSIATGEAGGPMAALAPLVGKIAGIERRPVSFEGDGMRFAVKAGELLDQACEGVDSPASPGEAMAIDNTMHPVNKRLSLAKATRSKFNVFGIQWDAGTKTPRNGHFAPFAWQG